MNYKNSIKNEHRKKCVSDRKYHRIIDLAGPQALSIKFLYDSGHINDDCDITIIDYKKKNLIAAEKTIKRIGLSCETHHGRIENFPTSGSYDWVNADTCSGFSFELGMWLNQLNMSNYGEVNIWLTCYRAKGELKSSLEETFSNSKSGGKSVARCVRENCIDDESKLLDNIPRSRKTEVWATACALATSFSQSFDIMPVQVYIAHVSRMYVYRFVNFGKGKLQFPNLDKLFVEGDYEGRQFNDPYSKSSMNVGENSLIHELISAAIQSPSHKPYCVKRIRQKIREAKLRGKSSKMIKAGWKSHITKITEDDAVRMQCHKLIDEA